MLFLLYFICLCQYCSSWETEIFDVSIPMRDGKFLIGDVYLPSTEGLSPTIFIHTPYNKDFGLVPLPDEHLAQDFRDREIYSYVIVDQRGRFASLPAWVLFPNNGEDGYDVIDWIVAQNWSSGSVGTWGVSAVGAIQYGTASEKPPSMKCMVPASGTFGYRWENYYKGGVLMKNYFDWISVLFGGGMVLDNDLPTDLLWTVSADIWDAQAPLIDLPALFVSAWWDTHTDIKIETFFKLATQEKNSYENMKFLIGPWIHIQLGAGQAGNLSFPKADGIFDVFTSEIFDHYLLGHGGDTSAWSQRPRVTYYELGSNEWLTADIWPPNSTTVPMFLLPNGQLSLDAVSSTSVDSYVYDPENPTPTYGGSNLIGIGLLDGLIGPQDLRQAVESRDDVLVYSSEVLASRIRIAGIPCVRLRIASDRLDTDFAVRLSDVYPDGRSMLMSEGIQRAKYREGYDEPRLLEIGSVYEVNVYLTNVAIVFEVGHRIRISVSSSNYPQFDVNTNDGDNNTVMLIATNEIHLGGESAIASALLLPVLEEEDPPVDEEEGSLTAVYVSVAVVVSVLAILLLVVGIVIVVVCVVKKSGKSGVNLIGRELVEDLGNDSSKKNSSSSSND